MALYSGRENSTRGMPFKKGHTTNIGRTMSEETRQKMSEAHKGQKPSRWGAGFRRGNTPWNVGANFARDSYYAGLFDGEGSICITNNGRIGTKYKKLQVTIAMRADKAQPLPEGQRIWGGSLRKRAPRKHNHNEVLDWRLYTRSAEKFLISIRPFLRIKKEQVELALQYRKIMNEKRQITNQIPVIQQKVRTKIEEKIKELNH